MLMVIQSVSSVVRVTLTLDPIDVDLLDRLARLEGVNRSQEVRSILAQVRPMLAQTVRAFEAALAQRDAFDEAAAAAAISGLQAVLPEIENLEKQYMGAMARLEGAAAAANPEDDSDPRPSSHGGHTPTPTNEEDSQ